MTIKEMETISTLQARGLGYKKISSITGLPLNTVKSYCRRHKVATVPNKVSDHGTCKCCGKLLTPSLGRRKKIYCSDTCRTTWWRVHSDQIQRKAYYSFVCPQCGRTFQSYGNSHRKYCSRACAADAMRKGGAAHEC